MPKGILIQNGVHLEKHEYETVKILLNHGFNIELIPPSRIKNLRMPDITLNGLAWEIKSPIGNGRKTIKNIIQTATHQSENIIIDLRRIKMPEENAMKEIERYFTFSKRIKHIMIIQKSKIIIDMIK